jgi:hypothetical protein
MPPSPVFERQTAPPVSVDDRHGGIVSPSESTRDIVQEDFLFHLYRGSELLQENRVLEAKEELEFALTMQPLDAKGQDLLGAVYFRLGLYPRAIAIYEALERQFPRDTSIKNNLALAYLKTGQPELARRVLQDAVRLQPDHKRAWGYLGLALQKLGELEQAQHAFERGGHALMAKRVNERRRQSMPPPPSAPPEPSPEQGRVREMAETAFSELDAGELRFALAEAEPRRPSDGPWHTLEIGEASKIRAPVVKSLPPASVRPAPNPNDVVTMPPPVPHPEGRELAQAHYAQANAAPPAVTALPRGTSGQAWSALAPELLVLPQGRDVALLDSGALLVRTREDPPQAFAGRLEALRIVSGTASTRVLHRRVNDADTSEVLGGIGSPLVRIGGNADLVLGTRPGRRIALMVLTGELLFAREERLLGFDLRLSYETGKVAFEHPDERTRVSSDGVSAVQLRGTGAVALELGGAMASIACRPGPALLVRREWVVGWVGRMVVRALPPAEAPSGQRGLVGFAGEGTVLVCLE